MLTKNELTFEYNCLSGEIKKYDYFNVENIFYIKTKDKIDDVIDKIISIILFINEIGEDWTDKVVDENQFPKDFLNKFRPDRTEAEANEWLRKWQSLSWDEKVKFEYNEPWIFSHWLYWMDPSERVWTWLKHKKIDDFSAEITIAGYEFPTPTEPFRWLLEACGAIEIIDLTPY